MPEISPFFGIVIATHDNDHVPPHFHARHGSDRAAITVKDMTVLEGSLPPRVLGLVIVWGVQHRDELLEDWSRSARQLPLVPIAPLE